MSETTALDDKILKLAPRMSPMEISSEINGVLSPSQVAARVKELLESRDWLSVLEKKKILNDRIWAMMDVYERFALDGNLKSADVFLRAAKELRQMLAEDSNAVDDQITRVTSAYAEAMAKAIGAALQMLMKRVRVPEEKALAILDEVIPVAVKELES